MGEDRMLLYVHKDIERNIDAIIDSYSRKYPAFICKVGLLQVSLKSVYTHTANKLAATVNQNSLNQWFKC